MCKATNTDYFMSIPNYCDMFDATNHQKVFLHFLLVKDWSGLISVIIFNILVIK